MESPITPLQSGGEMFIRVKSVPLFPPGTFKSLATVNERQLSPACSDSTRIWEEADVAEDGTDIDDADSSDFEEDYPAYSFSDLNEGRRSQTTISTYDEIQTPRSTRRSEFNLTIDPARSVEGPNGPHLFRSSQISAEFDFDFALQLSPLFPKKQTLELDTAFSGPQTASTVRGFPSNALAVTAMVPGNGTEPRNWSAERVAFWMSQCGVDAETCDRFESHDVTGAVLLDLTFEDLKELDIPSFGKRHQLWNHICDLRGGIGQVSPVPTPFEDVSSVGLARHRTECDEDPVTPGARRRRGRKPRRALDDPITPAESVSIVAIEQLIPKPHKCAKGENCSKWRKQQKLLKRIQEENGFPISPEKGGRIMFSGDPGNAASAPNIFAHEYRPTSEAIPSVVASSDLLGPGEQPAFPPSLQEGLVQQLQERDPQDNVRQFLTFQHLEPPQPVPVTPIDDPALPMFPAMPTMAPPQLGPSPLTGLQCLPRLSIPLRATSAAPQLPSASEQQPPQQHVDRSALEAFSPIYANPTGPVEYRFGTPASELDVPCSAFPVGPDAARDMSRSVPPSMHYRDPVARTTSAMNYRRGPSLQLPTLGEDEVFSPSSETTARASTLREEGGVFTDAINEIDNASTAGKLSGETLRSTISGAATTARGSGASSSLSKLSRCTASSSLSSSSALAGVNHAGWMKKRRTRLLRHEWADHHFRLTGTQLAMHANSVPSSSPLDTLNIDEYAVACSSLASDRKLASRFRALAVAATKSSAGSSSSTTTGGNRGVSSSAAGPSAFSFQLVPAGKDGEEKTAVRRRLEGGKVHHFAVRSVDERIDWMRELMLAKALKEKEGEGYRVQIMREGYTR